MTVAHPKWAFTEDLAKGIIHEGKPLADKIVRALNWIGYLLLINALFLACICWLLVTSR